jgi:phosphoribosylglycinamide formyltransferase-1
LDIHRKSEGTFVGESITPQPGTFDVSAMAKAEPGLPSHFTWRGTEYRVFEVLDTWKSLTGCVSGADEMYVRKHWFRIRTVTGEIMVLYCDRHRRQGKQGKKDRWTLYSIEKG